MIGDEPNRDAARTVDAEYARLQLDRRACQKLLVEGLKALRESAAQADKAKHCFHALEWLLDDPESED